MNHKPEQSMKIEKGQIWSKGENWFRVVEYRPNYNRGSLRYLLFYSRSQEPQEYTSSAVTLDLLQRQGWKLDETYVVKTILSRYDQTA